MSKEEVFDVRLSNVETRLDKHETMLSTMLEQHSEMKTGITEVATELRVTNEILNTMMRHQQRIVMSLIAIISGVLLGANYMLG
tara:strand:+ start:3210 stop:3461 length:252 start_codon:yes stop_codon:yes gene_type:complete